MKEKSYVMIKPEFANFPEVIEEVKKRLRENDIEIIDQDYIYYDVQAAKEHYSEHVGKSFYPNLEKYITSDKAYGMEVEGENAITVIRNLAGSTKNPEIGTIRYDIPKLLNIERRVTENVVHSSDCKEAAIKELSIFHRLKEKDMEL